jgi:hypothetical protein
MDIKQRLKEAVAPGAKGMVMIDAAELNELFDAAVAEIQELEEGAQLQLIPEDQAWQQQRRFDLFFAAAITGLSARKKHGTADDIARNAALIAMWAMGHKMPKMSEG